MMTTPPTLPRVLLRTSLFVLAAAGAASARPAAGDSSLGVVNTLQVGGDGRWDFITVDPATHRLYVPRSTHVQVLDADTGKPVADWPDTAGVHGVAIVPDKHLGFATNGGTGNVSVFDLNTNAKLADVPAGDGPDAIAYDAASGNVLAFNHKGGTVTFISTDPAEKFKTQTLEIGGTLEVGVVDGAGHAFVTVEDKNEVVAFDTKTAKVLNHWPLGKGTGPTGLAIDVANHRLFAGCGENDLLVVMDSQTGAVTDELPIGKGCDGVDFDAGLGQAYASCGDGTLAVARADAAGKVSITQTVQTKTGARTLMVDQATHKIYLPTAEYGPAEGARRPPMKPGTFQVVVVGAKA